MEETSVTPFGVLNINKPGGMTSRRVVDRVAKIVRPVKAGHAGTLDPLATGVLVVCVGAATRLMSRVQEQPKRYQARFVLGKRSNTDDIEGDVVDVPHATHITRELVNELLPKFTGTIAQVPPQFSAVHIDGHRAYKLARRGEHVEIKPRCVDVFRIVLTRFEFPELELDIECGSGTYIRAIGRDLGNELGCGAVMTSLVRARVGPYRLESAAALDQVTSETLDDIILPPTSIIPDLARYTCTADEIEYVRRGRSIDLDESLAVGREDAVALLTPTGELASLAEYDPPTRRLLPKQVFLSQV